MKVIRNYYFTGPEAALCCAAAGVRALPCFAGLRTAPDAEEAAEAACAMTGRGLLTGGADGALLLCPELSELFRTVGGSSRVVLVGQEGPDRPHCLIFGGSSRLALLWPGQDGRLGAGLYAAEDVGSWLADAHLALGEGLAPDLLEAVSEAEREADFARSPEVAALLRRYVFPGAAAPEGGVPPELLRCAEGCRVSDLAPQARLLIARLPLYDHVLWGTADGAADELYSRGRTAELILKMLAP